MRTGRLVTRPADLIRRMAGHDIDLVHVALEQLIDDMPEDGCPCKGQQLFRHAHPPRLTGGRYDGSDHRIG